MEVLHNDNTITREEFDDLMKAAKEVDKKVGEVFEKKIKGFQFFQEEHANRFKITKLNK